MCLSLECIRELEYFMIRSAFCAVIEHHKVWVGQLYELSRIQLPTLGEFACELVSYAVGVAGIFGLSVD